MIHRLLVSPTATPTAVAEEAAAPSAPVAGVKRPFSDLLALPEGEGSGIEHLLLFKMIALEKRLSKTEQLLSENGYTS